MEKRENALEERENELEKREEAVEKILVKLKRKKRHKRFIFTYSPAVSLESHLGSFSRGASSDERFFVETSSTMFLQNICHTHKLMIQFNLATLKALMSLATFHSLLKKI